MDSYIQSLLHDSGIDRSDVTIVDDNASVELTSPLSLLGHDIPINNTSSRSCRWSNITEEMNDLRIAKRILSNLRRSRSSPSAMYHPQSATFMRTTQSMQFKHNSYFGNERMEASAVDIPSNTQEAASSNRTRRYSSSFPANLPGTNRSNAGWDDSAIWKDAASIKKNIDSKTNDTGEQIEDSSSEEIHTDVSNDEVDSPSSPDEETEYDDDADSSEGSIDILEDILEDWAVREDLDFNSSTEKGSVASSLSTVKPKKFGSSADMTDTTFEMDSSYQSILDYSKLVSNQRFQAPRLPQRKISQEKLRTLSSFMGSNSSIDGSSEHDNSNKQNVFFEGVDAPDGRLATGILPLLNTASQIMSSGTRRRRRKKPASTSLTDKNMALHGKDLMHGVSSPMDHDIMSSLRAHRLRNALGPMAPSIRTPDNTAEAIDDIVTSPNRSRWSSYRSKIRANTKEVMKPEQPLQPPQSPPGTPKRRGGQKICIDTQQNNPLNSSSSCQSSSSSSRVDDSSSSAHSVHSVETVKISNLPAKMPIIVDRSDLEESADA